MSSRWGEVVQEIRKVRTERGTPSACAATWHILVCRPWPISMPPCTSATEPSRKTLTVAPAWFIGWNVNEMPNLVPSTARPRLRYLHTARTTRSWPKQACAKLGNVAVRTRA